MHAFWNADTVDWGEDRLICIGRLGLLGGVLRFFRDASTCHSHAHNRLFGLACELPIVVPYRHLRHTCCISDFPLGGSMAW